MLSSLASSLVFKLVVILGLAFGVVFGINSLYKSGYSAGVAVERVQALKRTEEAINEVKDRAERARAMRRYCHDSGMQYDFATVKCRQS